MPAEDIIWPNLSGIRNIGTSVTSDHTGAKMRKDTCAGGIWRQCDVHHEETIVISRGE
jgi:hypothetical protein